MKIIKRLRSLPGDSLGVIRRTPPLVFAMAVLSFGGFIGASTVLVRGFRTVENTITVTGASTESFESDIEYKRITKKLEEYDLMADVDDQRFHHFFFLNLSVRSKVKNIISST